MDSGGSRPCHCNRLPLLKRKLKSPSLEVRKQKREELDKPVWEGF